MKRYAAHLMCVSIGVIIGAFATHAYHKENAKVHPDATSADRARSSDVPLPSAETLARIKELEESTAVLVQPKVRQSSPTDVGDIKKNIDDYLPVPAEPEIIAGDVSVDLSSNRTRSQKVTDFIDADEPYRF